MLYASSVLGLRSRAYVWASFAIWTAKSYIAIVAEDHTSAAWFKNQAAFLFPVSMKIRPEQIVEDGRRDACELLRRPTS